MLFFARVYLLGCLSIFVILLLWPHTKPLIDQKIIIPILNYFLLDEVINELASTNQNKIFTGRISRHPRDLPGNEFKRIANKADTLQIQNNNIHNGQHSQANILYNRYLKTATSSFSQDSYYFGIFTASIIGVASYTFIKFVSLCTGCKSSNSYIDEIHSRDEVDENYIFNDNYNSRMGRQKSRNKRVGDMIMKLGSSKVSAAIKCLSEELKRQKEDVALQIQRNTSSDNCRCSCHDTLQ